MKFAALSATQISRHGASRSKRAHRGRRSGARPLSAEKRSSKANDSNRSWIGWLSYGIISPMFTAALPQLSPRA
jgi:hypothetical protein